MKSDRSKHALKSTGEGPIGQVIQNGAGQCLIRSELGDSLCVSRQNLAVGDLVHFNPEAKRVTAILPRKTELSRPDPHNPRVELIIAANIDIVVHVVSYGEPELRPGIIDRYLIAIEHSGAQPLICVNKSELDSRGEIDAVMQPYLDLGLRVIKVSAVLGIGLEDLRDALAGKLCVFTGHSGVGKSSLLNALADVGAEVPAARTGEIATWGARKGKHTTTASRLYELPNGARIIDTPGIRQLGLWNLSPDRVRHYFHEFDALSANCAYSDCTHTHEPRCAVKAAIGTGQVAQARYDTYLRILNDPSA